MTNYLDLLPTDVSELIYKKKFHLELVDGLKKFDGFWNIKLKLPKVTNFKIIHNNGLYGPGDFINWDGRSIAW